VRFNWKISVSHSGELPPQADPSSPEDLLLPIEGGGWVRNTKVDVAERFD